MSGLWRAGSAGDFDPVAAEVADADVPEIGDGVRRDVPGGIGHLIEKLLLDGRGGDQPAAARQLAEHAMPVGFDIGEGEAQVGEAGNVLDARIGEIAARDLAGAFQQMADHRRLPDPLAIARRQPSRSQP